VGMSYINDDWRNKDMSKDKIRYTATPLFIDKGSEKKVGKSLNEDRNNVIDENKLPFIPKSIMIFMIIICALLGIFTAFFILAVFTDIHTIHPFISLTSIIGLIGLLVTAVGSIKDINNI